MKHYITYDKKHPDKNTDSIVFPTRSEAEAVLNALDEDVELFGRTSLEKFHCLCLLPSSEEEKAMGWDEKEFAKVSINRTRAGYAIVFPEPKEIKPLPELKEIFPNCNFAELQYKNCSILSSVNEQLRELSEKGYVTLGEILEATEPIRTGYDWVPEDYDWPKMPENWLDEISKQKVYIVECYSSSDGWRGYEEEHSEEVIGVFGVKLWADTCVANYIPEKPTLCEEDTWTVKSDVTEPTDTVMIGDEMVEGYTRTIDMLLNGKYEYHYYISVSEWEINTHIVDGIRRKSDE